MQPEHITTHTAALSAFSSSFHWRTIFWQNSSRFLAQYVRRVFVWGRRPDVSSGRFLFHVRYFDFDVWGIFSCFIIVICFNLSISWIYRLEDNRILQLNSSKVPNYFSSLLIEWNIQLVNEIEETILFSFLLGQVERETPWQNTLHVLVEHLLEKWRE